MRNFYNNYNVVVALSAKILLTAIVVWAAFDPQSAGTALTNMNNWAFDNLKYYYNWTVGFFITICVLILLIPKWGRIKLGYADEAPEFSNFSWFAMMFGAGIGIGMLGFATGEPISYLKDNPEIRISTAQVSQTLQDNAIAVSNPDQVWQTYEQAVADNRIQVLEGLVQPGTESAIQTAYRYEFLHWGFSAWACYALVGMALGFAAYRRELPLTIRSTIEPLVGGYKDGWLGNVVDVCAVIATVLGISQTIGLGLSTFASGLHNITAWSWLMTTDAVPEPTLAALLLALFIVMLCATLSALSGVGRGIKWLSNLNMVLSAGLIIFFILFGSTWFCLTILGNGLIDYLLHLPALTFYVYPTQDAGSPGEWQAWWSIFYWAWWIAFAPFVGLFLARISKNRTLREFVFGAVICPSLMCFVWFALLGGTAIDLELSGIAQGSIYAKTLTAQLFEVVNIILSPGLAKGMSVLIVILLLTYLVTSADSAALVANLITVKSNPDHITKTQTLTWCLLISATIGALLLAGGLQAIQSAMILGSIPFSVLMILMSIGLVKNMINAVD